MARPVIDVHCHVFNGKDIPCRAFIRIVVFENFPELVDIGARGFFEGIGDRAKLGAANTIVAMIEASAPSVPDERDCVVNDRCSWIWPSFGGLPGRDAGASQQNLDDQLVQDYLRLKSGQPREKFFKGDEWKDEIENLDAFMGTLVETDAISSDAGRSNAAKKLAKSDFELGPLLSWGKLLTSYRRDIIARYLETYDQSPFNILLLTPAMVDFNAWLPGADTVEPLAEQVDLMSLLSQKQTTARMHGYCPFDPLRHVHAKAAGNKTTPLALCQRAVKEAGFLGVKLYPPMGFRASDNASAGKFPKFVKPAPTFGRDLDTALYELYTWCEAEGVPILAHASDSQGANHNFGERADPIFWRKPLADFPALRLCLAHFGNFAEVPGAGKDITKTWEWVCGGIVRDGKTPNFYVDLSYFGALVGKDDKAAVKTARDGLKRWIAEFDPACQRLLYGTDWSMIAKEGRNEYYLLAMDSFLRSVGLTEAQLDNIYFKNAVRFFGLDLGGKARARLESYYAANNLFLGHLKKFDFA